MSFTDDLAQSALEIALLRKAIRVYGDRIRMANCADPQLQEAIDRAMAQSEPGAIPGKE